MGDVDGDGDLDLLKANSSGNTVSVRFNQPPVPVLASLSPTSGPVGTSVTLTGTGFGGATGISFNGTAALAFGASSATTATATVPAGASSGSVTITTAGGTSNGVAFTVTVPLTISSTSPAANARAASASGPVSITFSHPITAGSTAALKVFSAQRGGLRGSGSGGTTVSGSTVRFGPVYVFRPGETVQVTVTTAATATAGSRLTTARVLQFTVAAGTGPGVFGGGTNPAAGTRPASVAVADVDGDGDLDLLVANSGANTVSVRLNNGSGGFGGGSDVAVGSQPYSVAMADVDGDGDLDMLAANSGAATVSVRLNGGSGNFSGGTDVAVGAGSGSVAMGDVDGDGDLDLLTANAGANTVSVRLNNGSGVFGGGADPAVGTRPASVAVADVDGDGDLDMLVANSSANTASVRLNNGSGVFGGGSDVAVGTSPSSVAVADVDGDGDLDLLTANLIARTVSVRLNNGSGVFGGGSDPAVGRLPYGVAVGDVDGDGDLDLLTANGSASGTVSVRLNDGSGGFGGGIDVAVGASPNSVAVGDVDGDGDLDLLTANYDAATVSVRFNQPPVPVLTSLSPTSGPVSTSVTLTGTGFTGATAVRFTGTAAMGFTVVSATSITATVPAGASTGNVIVTTPGGTSATSATTVFTVTVPVADLIISTGTLAAPTAIAAGTYNNITVTGTGNALLGGAVVVNGTLQVLDGGSLSTDCQPLTGPGAFDLPAGATLLICDPAGIATTGATGAVQLSGPRSFSPGADYVYNGIAAQVTGAGLPATVRRLTLSHSGPAGQNTLSLSQPLTIGTGLTLNSGTLAAGTSQLVLGSTATLSESETSYVLGTVATSRPLVPGSSEAFGGLGLRLSPAAGSVAPGPTLVTRTTGTALTGAGTSQSILRSFDIQPAVNTGLNVGLAFAYFTHELNGITPANLRLFKSETGTAPWVPQRDATLAPNLVSKTGITDFSVWTLGDAANPLPVELTAFTVRAQAGRALLEWRTASETNSAYFEVQRSDDARTFGPLGQVSGQGTSTTPHAYAWPDATPGPARRYYRLRQLDRDGTAHFSPVRTLRLEAVAGELALFPNPTTGAVTLRGAVPGTPVTVLDALGRPLLAATADAAGQARLRLPPGTPAGVYVVRNGDQSRHLVVQ